MALHNRSEPPTALVEVTPRGLFCSVGGFYIDPWRSVPRAVITHAHSDHATNGCGAYLCSLSGKPVLRERVGKGAVIEGLPWGQTKKIGDATVSLHPAGHILGSAQVRIEVRGEVWVLSGDYKTIPDVSCEAFEPVKCDCFITESTFGLPLYRWPEPATVFEELRQWWAENRAAGRTSVVFAYPLGKSQRLLAGLAEREGPVGIYGNAARFYEIYRKAGYPQAEAAVYNAETISTFRDRGGLLIAPAMLLNTRPLNRLGEFSTAFASGWMRLRGARRRQAVDRGFVLSDHADWPGLLEAIKATGAARIGVTHGYTSQMVRYLREECSLEAWEIPTRFTGESAETEAVPDEGEGKPSDRSEDDGV
jgi:putative mRNA 3-end processing factor